MEQLFYNGIIFTMDEKTPMAEAALVRDGFYVKVGTNDELRACASEDAVLIDFNGAAAYPGMVDSHLHILNYAITSRALVLNDIKSRKEVFDAVKERAKTVKAGEYLDGRGFNEDLWDDNRLPTRSELDIAAPDRAVRLTRVCGHMVIANSLAIEKAGIDKNTPVPDGGAFDIGTGVFCENAINLLFTDEGDRGVEACKELLYSGLSMAADKGLTGIHSDDFGVGGFSMHTVAKAYRELEKEGRMPVRVVQQCALADEEQFKEFIDAGFYYGQGSDMYKIGPRKLYSDGSLGARTAWLSMPYADAPEKTGVPIYKQSELNRLAVQSHEARVPFIVHAIGDAGAASVIEAIRYARKNVPGTDDLPSGIVHCQITTQKILDDIINERIYIYAQPVFTEYDLHICRDRVGEEKEKTSYNWATLKHAGVCISSGSDCPVEPLDPAKNIYCAVTRKDFEHYPEGGWMKEQCLTVDEAVECHTVKAAEAVGMGDRLGRIKEGYIADMTVFPKALDAIAPDDILDQKPILTVLSGKIRSCR